MAGNVESFQQQGKEHFEAGSALVSSVTQGWQGLVAETADYSTKCFERNQALAGKLGGVKGIDEAIQLQSEFAKSAYEAFIAHATNIGSLYSDIAKAAFKTTKVASSGQVPINSPQSKTPPAPVTRS
jgi:hypothetical protein